MREGEKEKGKMEGKEKEKKNHSMNKLLLCRQINP